MHIPGTETTQLAQSKESCEKLRSARYDETATLVGASSNERIVKCRKVTFASANDLQKVAYRPANFIE